MRCALSCSKMVPKYPYTPFTRLRLHFSPVDCRGWTYGLLLLAAGVPREHGKGEHRGNGCRGSNARGGAAPADLLIRERAEARERAAEVDPGGEARVRLAQLRRRVQLRQQRVGRWRHLKSTESGFLTKTLSLE